MHESANYIRRTSTLDCYILCIWGMCVQAEIATPGTADSFLRDAHVTRRRRAHQITASTLHILQRHAYTRHCMTDFDDAEDLPEFEDWCHRRAKDTPPHFQYWATVLELDLLVLIYVRSLRQASFAEQNNALIKGDGGSIGLTDNPSALLL